MTDSDLRLGGRLTAILSAVASSKTDFSCLFLFLAAYVSEARGARSARQSSPRVFIGGLSSGFLQKTKRLGTKLQHLLAFQQL